MLIGYSKEKLYLVFVHFPHSEFKTKQLYNFDWLATRGLVILLINEYPLSPNSKDQMNSNGIAPIKKKAVNKPFTHFRHDAYFHTRNNPIGQKTTRAKIIKASVFQNDF